MLAKYVIILKGGIYCAQAMVATVEVGLILSFHGSAKSLMLTVANIPQKLGVRITRSFFVLNI